MGSKRQNGLKVEHPEIKVIILTTFQEDEYIFNGLKNGADGYVFKDSGSEAIMESIHAACSGNMLLNPVVSQKLMSALNAADSAKREECSPSSNEILTPREIEVCGQILKGKSNREIGEALYVTEGTVKNYISHILDKLNLNSRTELAVKLQNGRKA